MIFVSGTAVAAAGDPDILVNHDGLYNGSSEIGGLARGSFTYRAKVKLNTGNDASGVTLTQELPEGAIFQSFASEPSGISCSTSLTNGTVITATNKTVNCSIGELKSTDGFKWVDFNVMLPTVGTNWEAFASASLPSGASDGDGGTNNVNLRRNFTTYNAADLSVNLSASTTSLNNGDPYTYTIKVMNNGPTEVPAAGLTRVSFEVPSGAIISGPPIGGGAWNCTASGSYPLTSGTITCDANGQLQGTPATALPNITIPAEAAMSGPIGASANVQGFRDAALTPMPDGQSANNTDSVIVTASGSGYVDMSISKTASRSTADAIPGNRTPIKFTLVARRVAGSLVPSDIILTDELPSTLNFLSFDNSNDPNWFCSHLAGIVSCKWAGAYPGNIATDMPAVAFFAESIPGSPMAAGATLANTATLHLENQLEPNTTNNTSTALVTFSNTAQLGLTKSKIGSQLPILVGTSFQYLLKIDNNGPMDVLSGQPITVVETPSAGLMLTGVSAGWSCSPAFGGGATDSVQTCTNASGLAAGASTDLTFEAIVPDLSGMDFAQFANNATATAGPGRDGQLASSDATVTVSQYGADIKVTKAVEPPTVLPVKSGEEVTYRITVSNIGSVVTKDIAVRDELRNLVIDSDGVVSGAPALYPQGGFISVSNDDVPVGTTASCLAPSGGASDRTRTLSCSIDTLSPGQLVSFLVKVRPKVDLNNQGTGGTPTLHINSVSAYSSSISDGDLDNNTESAPLQMTALVDLTVAKQVAPLTEAAAGEPATYTVTTSNQGPSHAEAVKMVDKLPANAYLIGAPTIPGGGVCTYRDKNDVVVTSPDGMLGGTMSCEWSTPLNAKSQYVVTYKARSEGAQPAPGATMFNEVDVTTSTEEIRTDNNNAQAVISLKPAELDVAIDMNHTNDGLVLGESTEYTLIIKNTGASYATQVKVLDSFPASIVDNGITLNSNATFSYQGGLALAGVAGASPSWCTEPPVGSTSGQLDCTIPLMAPGETVTIKFSMTADALPTGASTGTIFHRASVKPAEVEYLFGGSDVLANNTTSDRTSTSQTAHAVDLGIVKNGPSSMLNDGDTATYTITVTNYGRDAQSPTGAKVTDVLPAGLTFVSAPGACIYNNATRVVECNVAPMTRGSTAVFTLITTLDKPFTGARPLINEASVSAPGDGNPDNNNSKTTTPIKPHPSNVNSIPTLSQWGLIMLSLVMGGMFYWQRKRA